ncbi:MAG: hypothetical protein LBS20_09525 [Prevotella sp.]|jgi:hypothetical protein|nr:hypothetical protein [Prevotella sp.]
MALEKSQIKFARSEETGELIGFVSRHSKTKKLKGVREDSIFGKKICVLSEDLKGLVVPNILYDVELKGMHQSNGYVVVSAMPVLFKARVDTVIVTKSIYQVNISFGNKTIYFDPVSGKSPSSKTVEGALCIINERMDIMDKEKVIEDFSKQALMLVQRMEKDGYYFPKDKR